MEKNHCTSYVDYSVPNVHCWNGDFDLHYETGRRFRIFIQFVFKEDLKS